MDSTDLQRTSEAAVAELQELVDKATDLNVEACYMTAAYEIKSRMERSLAFRDILGKFTDYPQRIYPDPPLLDKKGKPIKDPKAAKAPPPKKKKKGPQFLTPEWAVELSAVRQEYQKMD